MNLLDLGVQVLPGTKYYVWVMPLTKSILDEENSWPEDDYYSYDHSAYDYEADFKPYVIEVETKPLLPGGTCEASIAFVSATYSAINVTITPAEGTQVVFYEKYSLDDWSDFDENLDDVRNDLIEFGNQTNVAKTDSKTYIDYAGKSFVWATVSIDQE